MFISMWQYDNIYCTYYLYSPAAWWKNCGFDDKSMKFGTVVLNAILKNISYGPISKIQYGGHFENGRQIE